MGSSQTMNKRNEKSQSRHLYLSLQAIILVRSAKKWREALIYKERSSTETV